MSIPTLSDAIVRDHNKIRSYYKEYQKKAGDITAQHKLSSKVTWLIARHSIIEELVVFPLLAKFPDGEIMIKDEKAEHRALNRHLSNLLNFEPGSSDYASQVHKIFTILFPHFKKEEEEDLPLLERNSSLSDLGAAADKFLRMQTWTPQDHRLTTLEGLLRYPENAKAELNGSVVYGTVGTRKARKN